MTHESQIAEHLERALVETLFAIAEFDHMRAKARARSKTIHEDSLAGILLMLKSALDSAHALARTLTPARPAPDYSSPAPESRR
jgi:hypothetical protein